MTIRYILLVSLLSLAVLYDLRTYRIPNRLIAVGFIAGLLLNLILGGINGILTSLAAAVIPAVLLIVLFTLRMLGAGDIKLFCSIGAIMGIQFILNAIAFSFIAGGVLAIIIMVLRGNTRFRLKNVGKYLKTCLYTGKFMPYTDFNDKNDGGKFHFSVAIAAGCLISILTN
jgi:prepilin peptidase CpaA